MTLLTPLMPVGDSRLGRRDPVAKLGMAAIITVALVVSGDLVTPAILLGIEMAVLPLSGVGLALLTRRSWPLLLAVAGVALTNLLVVGEVEAAVQVSLRLVGISLPGLVVLATTDPLDLADALVQHLHASPRFAYGALAGLRLLPLLSADWHQLNRARRARGIAAGRSPIAGARLFASLTFALLVAAIRRGVRLAAAMDARGFDAEQPRSIARPHHFGLGDWVLLVVTLAAAAAAIGISVAAGAWTPIFS